MTSLCLNVDARPAGMRYLVSSNDKMNYLLEGVTNNSQQQSSVGKMAFSQCQNFKRGIINLI